MIYIRKQRRTDEEKYIYIRGTFYPRLNKEIDDASNACVFPHTKPEGRRETTVIVCHTVSPLSFVTAKSVVPA